MAETVSEFPEWVERELGLGDVSYERAQEIHRQLADGTLRPPVCDRQAARELLESSRIEWRRDWDAMAIWFALGVLVTLVLVLV